MASDRPLAMLVLAGILASAPCAAAFGAYKQAEPKPLPAGAIEVTEPGMLSKAGATYVLTRDISSDRTALFLASGVTLDLGGHTVTYASGDYAHVTNYGFEEGLKGWDVSKAPGAQVLDTDKVKPFIGKKILKLPAGQEIVSQYVRLPVAGRSYYAMCGVLTHRMRVRVAVDDEQGRPVERKFTLLRKPRAECPVTATTKLGGGFVVAHLHGLPAGKYRIRVRAEGRDALIDEVDIRPAIDCGVGIVDSTRVYAYHKALYDGEVPAFVDYTRKGSYNKPLASIPIAKNGTVTIKNGVIKSGVTGVQSWGVQSTARGVTLKLENVKIVASGITTNAVSHPGPAVIRDCRFEIDTPFIINRHMFAASPVSIGGKSDVSGCEFVGGQGCLNANGDGSVIHDNLFVNRQTVTNHYSVMLGGRARGVKIYRNRFEPEIGSGITMFGVKDCEVYENTFKITAANGNCEYTNEDYSTNAIRITDYNAPKGAEKGAFGNRIHHNKFHITGRHYTNYRNYKPVATALFCSVGAGKNYVHDNEITVNHENPGTPAVACAFYIGGSRIGGEYYNNRITTNVPAFWIGTFYGDASGVVAKNNTITRAEGAPAGFKPFRLGYGRIKATGIKFIGNRFVNCEFGVQSSNQSNRYTRE